jgi:Uma2 family endonuclease
MSGTAAVSWMSTEELLALPEDDVERDLIRGELRERPMTKRSRRHSRTEDKLARFLGNWLAEQPEPRGEILDGKAGFRLRRDPDTTVGIDLAYISPELAAATPEDAWLVDGVPGLAVEILSLSEKQEEILEKVREYLDAGVALVWIIEPVFRTVTVYRPGMEPEIFNVHEELSGEPHLPGSRVAVAEIFKK